MAKEPPPPEYAPYNHFYFVAESLDKYNYTAALVMRHVFCNSCIDDIVPGIGDYRVAQYMERYQKSLPDFPCDGPTETKNFADEMFATLSDSLEKGRVTTTMPEQFWILSVVYSVLEGDEVLHRERLCRNAGARLLRALATAKKPMPVIPDLSGKYNAAKVDEYLAVLGIPVTSDIPELKPSCKSSVLEDIDAAIDLIRSGDRGGANNSLFRALNTWEVQRAPKK